MDLIPNTKPLIFIGAMDPYVLRHIEKRQTVDTLCWALFHKTGKGSQAIAQYFLCSILMKDL